MRDGNEPFIRKRTIIAIFITLTVFILFILTKPMLVSFDIDGNDEIVTQVQLNKKDNDEFIKTKKASAKLDIQDSAHVNLFVENSRSPKRIRLILSELEKGNTFTISNIMLGNDKIHFDKLENFKVEGANVSINKNKLELVPFENTVILTYKEPLHIITTIKFDFKVIIISIILGYLLAFKLTNYIADFKTIKKKSRIDIIFLLIFFIFLFIPMSHINDSETSEYENRTLAKWKPLIFEDYNINYNFGNNYNEWFNDRFALRKNFITIYNINVIFSKFWETKDVIKGQDNWLFLGWKESKNNYTNSVMFTEKELREIDDYLNQINEYCKSHNKRFYVLIAPDKSKVYGEFYSYKIRKIQDKSKTQQLIEYIGNHSNIKVVYPINELLSHKTSDLIYWKTDTHWTPLGAYYGYEAFMKYLVKDYNNVSVYKVTDFYEEEHNGDLFNMAPSLLKKKDDTKYKMPMVDASNLCQYGKGEKDEIVCNNPNGKLNLVIYRDSFSASLVPYFANTFKKSRFIWQDTVIQNTLDEADIVIFEIVERRLPELVGKHMEVQ